MLVPLSWLKDYVEIDVTPQELEEKLFSCGFEVEELHQVGEAVSNVVAGLVETCEAIPDTHLHVCRVNAGDHGTFQVCCGADNVQTGGKYPLALAGATVYMTAKDHKTVEGVMTIKKGKLRGYESEGMLCSGVELGVSENLFPGAGYNGLLVLPQDVEPGADVKPILGLDDWIFDISITANRPDCQSIMGIAREVAAVLDKPFRMPALDYTETAVKKEGFTVTVDAPDLCPRYIGHYVYDVQIGESPQWMKRRLALMGQEPISNIVDITNYVLLEMGQPMHAFDFDYLEGNAIEVRRAGQEEKITTLDGQEYILNTNNLVICDGVKPVALAGVMGGLNSEIRESTREVLFESAKFARDNIRKTSRGLGKRTDASARYEKGVDEYFTVHAMERALHLIQELGCGKVSSTHVDVNTGNRIDPREMKVSVRKVEDVLGIEVPVQEILRIMKNLDFAPTLEGDELTLQVPAYREDMEDYPDVAEEVIRMYGYDHVVPAFMPQAQVTMGGVPRNMQKEMKLKRALCGAGAYECIHYSFFSPSDLDLLHLPQDAPKRQPHIEPHQRGVVPDADHFGSFHVKRHFPESEKGDSGRAALRERQGVYSPVPAPGRVPGRAGNSVHRRIWRRGKLLYPEGYGRESGGHAVCQVCLCAGDGDLSASLSGGCHLFRGQESGMYGQGGLRGGGAAGSARRCLCAGD